jgi:hypothetical protein
MDLDNPDGEVDLCGDLVHGGFTDWRVPDIKELLSIYDPTKTTEPMIDLEAFPNTQPFYFWSSTSRKAIGSYAWVVSRTIDWSPTSTFYKYESGPKARVHCVRGGAAD